MKKITLVILITIVLGGFLLRIWDIGNNPSGFFADEASIGYNAYTILTKGADEFGIKYPIFFRAFGEYKSPLEIYSTVPFTALFGLNEFSVRFTSVFFGTLSIFSVFLLTKQLFKKYKHNSLIALLSSFFLAISPWHIHFSRAPFEGFMPFVFFTTFGTYFFLRTLKNPSLLPISVTAFVFAVYSYFPARIFIPLFGISLAILHFKFFLQNIKLTIFSIVLLLLLLIPLINFTLSPVGFSRWNQVNIFSQPPENETVTRHIVNNYLSHFSLDFLFLKGDIDMPGQFITRHSVRGIGELYLFQLLLIILGFLYLFSKREKRIIALLILWLMLYPTGSMFTIDKSAQATRSIIGVIPLQIVSAVGLWFIFLMISKQNKILNYLLVAIIAAIILFSFTRYLNLYFIRYPLYSSDFWGWQYGPKEIMRYFLTVRNDYDDLYMSGEFNAGHIFISFYDPQNTCQSKCKMGDFFREPQIYNPSKRQLFSLSPDYLSKSNFIKDFLVKKTIYYPNGNIAFQIGEIVK